MTLQCALTVKLKKKLFYDSSRPRRIEKRWVQLMAIVMGQDRFQKKEEHVVYFVTIFIVSKRWIDYQVRTAKRL